MKNNEVNGLILIKNFYLESQDVKSNKPKPREFKVSTLCFYEKPSTPDNDAGANPATYDSMTREIWVPSEDVSSFKFFSD